MAAACIAPRQQPGLPPALRDVQPQVSCQARRMLCGEHGSWTPVTVHGRACGSTSPSQYMSFRSIGRPTKMSNLRAAKQGTFSKAGL